MLHRSFKPAKCKTALNLAKSRIKLMKNKKENQFRQLKREIAHLLESGQDQTARIRVEHVIREEKLMAAYEMIEIYCELVVARLPIIESQKNCPLDLKEAIASLIFAAPRCADITELQDVRKHFTAKYGKEFAIAAAEVRPACGVSRTLIEKLSVNPPDGQTKVKVLTAIAEEHNIQWEPNWFKEENQVPSVHIPTVEVGQSTEGSKIQMQPLNFEIADDLLETHAHDKARPETFSQTHVHTNSNLVPPSSSSRPDSRPSESSSQKIIFGQSSGTAESAFAGGRQKWDMEFKDATAAAQAAAESAEMASLAARAAAELSIRSNMMTEDNLHNAGSGPQQNHVHVNSTSGSSNQRSSRFQNQGVANGQVNMREGGDSASSNKDYTRHGGQYETGKLDFTERKHSRIHSRDSDSTSSSFNQRSSRLHNQGDANRQGNMTEGGDATGSNKDFAQYGGQYEVREQDFTERKNSRMNTTDSDSTPITFQAEPSMFSSSNFQENEIDSSENPFHEETEERKNHFSSFKFKSSTFGDEYGVFENLHYDDDKHDSGDGSFGSFSKKTADQEDWHVRSPYTFGEEDMTFKDHGEGNRVLESDNKYGFDSGSAVFVGMDHRTSGEDIDEKGIHSNAEVFFDESGSDEDDKSVSNPAEEHDFPSPAEPTHMVSSLNQDNRYFEPDLSESFKRSPIYSKLTEPMPMTFDDSDGPSSGSEKEQQKEKCDPGVPSYDYQKPDADPHHELRSSFVERGTVDSFMSSKDLEEHQNKFSGAVSKNMFGFDNSGSSESPDKTGSAAVSIGFNRSVYDLFDEGEPLTSLQSLRVSENPVSEYEYETQPTPEGGMELNLGSLPGGRRNRAHGRMPRGRLADVSSPPRFTEAAPSNTFGSSAKASAYEFQVSSSQIDNKQAPMKRSELYTHYVPGDDTEKVIVRKDLDSAERPYRMANRIDGNVRKTSLKDRTIYFDSDDSSSEEDVPKPVASKTFRGAGLSRRTKASSPRSVVSSHTSVAAKTGRSSSSHNTEVSSSRIIDQSSWDNSQNLARKSSEDKSSSSSVPEKPVTPKSPNLPESSSLNEKAPSRENSAKNPSHVHPKLPDFETFTAHLQSLRKNHQ